MIAAVLVMVPRVLVVVATARTEGVVADEVTDGDAAVA